MVRLRFNLGRGENYKKWQLKTHKDEEVIVEHFDPSEVTILLIDATLTNSKTTAQKIFEGQNKTVCAWVKAKAAYVFDKNTSPVQVTGTLRVKSDPLRYNPRQAPNWVDSSGQDVDGMTYSYVVTDGRGLLNISPVVRDEFRGGKIPDLELFGWVMHDIRLREKFNKLLTV